MHVDDAITVDRVARVLRERVRPAVHGASVPLDAEHVVLDGEPVGFAEAAALPRTAVDIGDPWGRAWGTTWFHLAGRVPDEWAGRAVEAVVDLGFDTTRTGFQCEGLVYDERGRALKGLNPRNQWVRVADAAEGGEDVRLIVEAASNPVIFAGEAFRPTRQGDPRTATDELLYRVRRMDIAVFEPDVFDLAIDLEVLVELQAELPAGPRRARILQALDDALDHLDLQDVAATATAARDRLAGVLSQPAAASAHRLAAVGHAHIDSAWLWPVRETVRKVARTVASMLSLIDDTDDFVYGMSSAQQYAWLQEHQPELWSRLLDAVDGGRFVPLGGMWVESDTVMPSGESLARQFLYGQRYFEEELGVTCRGVWLPDSFGYSPALPQLLVDAGFEWFFTQKISWNQTNDFPHHAFRWAGIDGTSILTHFPPIDTYNAELSGAEVAHAQRGFHENRIAPASVAPTGHGDGGGGTTREMVARAQRLADLEGSPRVAWQHPDDFFDELAGLERELPSWSGELYLELHRATLTSQHAMKQGNRRLEELLVEAELWAATASVRAELAYPHDELDELWHEVLLLQFHDILPGTSIAWVHREARERYRQLEEQATAIVTRSLGAVTGSGDRDLVANGARHDRDGVPPGAVRQRRRRGGRVTLRDDRGGFALRNEHVALTVSDEGLVTSLVDSGSGREVVTPEGAVNVLHLHQDLPNRWDAWDVDPFYRGMVREVRDVADMTPFREDGVVGVRVRRRISEASSVVQTILLRPDSRVVEFDQLTDWHEREKFLKLAFDLDVRASAVLAETQFGHVARPTHDNTSWDAARFETSMHRFAHVGEPGFGVALLNGSSYGYDDRRIAGTNGWGLQLRASVLRAPRFPDPDTDAGTHHHRFGLIIGTDVADAARAGALFNARPRERRGSSEVEPVVVVAGRGIALSSVKEAVDRSGDLVVRVHELAGARAEGRLRVGFAAAEAWRTGLLEQGSRERVSLEASGDVALRLRPFEVQTWRIRRHDE